jgi:hypothetical protein
MRRTFLRVLGVSAAEYATRFTRHPRSSEEASSGISQTDN